MGGDNFGMGERKGDEMKTDYKIGNIVSAASWDATEPLSKRMGECVVTKVTTGARSESGVTIDVRNPAGKVLRGMDVAWFRPADSAEKRNQQNQS